MPVQKELWSLIVRPIQPREGFQWNELMAAHHYLGFRQLVGESIKYVAEIDGQWLHFLVGELLRLSAKQETNGLTGAKNNNGAVLST